MNSRVRTAAVRRCRGCATATTTVVIWATNGRVRLRPACRPPSPVNHRRAPASHSSSAATTSTTAATALMKWTAVSMSAVNRGRTSAGTVLGIFIWVGQSKVKQILGRPTEVVYAGNMRMTRAVWVGQEWVRVGHGLPGLIARTASGRLRPAASRLGSVRRLLDEILYLVSDIRLSNPFSKISKMGTVTKGFDDHFYRVTLW